MIDRYTKVLLTVIAVNLTVMTGWGALEVFVPEVTAGGSQDVFIVGQGIGVELDVRCRNCD